MKVPLYQNNRKKGLPGVHSVITQSFPKGAFYVNLAQAVLFLVFTLKESL